ncbi:putative motility protein [Methylorubrum extorquens]
MTAIAAQAVQMQAAAFSQQVGTAIARQQIDAERSVAQLVAQTASPPAPPGQGQVVDLKV